MKIHNVVMMLILSVCFSLSAVSAETKEDGSATLAVTQKSSPTEQLVQRLKPVASMRGSFQQRIVDQQGLLLQETRGEFKVKRPGHFYWKTNDPYDQLLVTDNEKLWQYDGDLDQATVQPYSDSINNTPALLLSGEIDKLKKAYLISMAAARNGQVFELLPTESSNLFEKMTVEFENDQLKAMQLLDGLGQKTELVFSDLQTNIDIPTSLFTFVPPEGVDLIIDE